MKIAYLIPGYGENFDRKDARGRKIIDYFVKKGIKPIPIKINWKYRTMSDYTKQFEEQQVHTEKDEIYLFGFSYGAFISFAISPKVEPKMQIICSLSPYFKEDLKYLPKWWCDLSGKKRIKDFENFSFDAIAEKISRNTETVLFVGSKERINCVKRAEEARRKIKNSKLIVVEGARHNMKGRYLEEVINFLNKI